MFRKQRQVFQDLNLIVDIIGLELILVLSYYLRFYWGPIPLRYPHIVPLGNYLWIFIFFPFIWIFAGMESGLYRVSLTKAKQMAKIFRTLIVAMLLIISISFLLKRFEYSRLVFSYFGFLAFIFLMIHRYFWKHMLRLLSRSKMTKKALLIDSGTGVGARLTEKIKSSPELGINLIGWVPLVEGIDPAEPIDLPRLGAYQDLNKIIRDFAIQSVLVCAPLLSSMLEKLFTDIGKTLVDIVLVPDFQEMFLLDQQAESIDGFSFFHMQTTRLEGWNLVLKRIFDLIGSITIIILLSPLFLLISLAIKLTSKGPVFFRQSRFGANEKEFRMFKFRTMVHDAEALTNGPVRAERDDPRVTKVGRFLRKSSLDELPNLFNVVKGEMSLVGPRPEAAPLFEKVKESNPLYSYRHKFKPGMTGWAQINGLRGGHYIDKKFEHDIYYIQNWSLVFDLKILIMTIWKGFYAPNAY